MSMSHLHICKSNSHDAHYTLRSETIKEEDEMRQQQKRKKNDDGKTKHQLNIHEKIVIRTIVRQFIETSIWISK